MILQLRGHFTSIGFAQLLRARRNRFNINRFEATEFHRLQYGDERLHEFNHVEIRLNISGIGLICRSQFNVGVLFSSERLRDCDGKLE
jgi:hypothetical protein